MNAWIENLPGPAVKRWVEDKSERVMERYHTDDPHFALWLHYVNKAVARRTGGLSFSDLEDWDYAAAYEGDMDPRETAVQMLRDNGWAADL